MRYARAIGYELLALLARAGVLLTWPLAVFSELRPAVWCWLWWLIWEESAGIEWDGK